MPAHGNGIIFSIEHNVAVREVAFDGAAVKRIHATGRLLERVEHRQPIRALVFNGEHGGKYIFRELSGGGVQRLHFFGSEVVFHVERFQFFAEGFVVEELKHTGRPFGFNRQDVLFEEQAVPVFQLNDRGAALGHKGRVKGLRETLFGFGEGGDQGFAERGQCRERGFAGVARRVVRLRPFPFQEVGIGRHIKLIQGEFGHEQVGEVDGGLFFGHGGFDRRQFLNGILAQEVEFGGELREKEGVDEHTDHQREFDNPSAQMRLARRQGNGCFGFRAKNRVRGLRRNHGIHHAGACGSGVAGGGLGKKVGQRGRRGFSRYR